jgi:hypothetical protein
MASYPPGFYGGGQPEPRRQPQLLTAGSRRMSDLLLPDEAPSMTNTLAEVPTPEPRVSGLSALAPSYVRQADGSLLSQVGEDLGRATDETAGLRANAPQFRSAWSLEDVTLAGMEAEQRFREAQEARDAPLYRSIAAAEARRRDPVEDEIEMRRKEITRDRLRPAAPQTLNDLGVSEEMTAGEVIPIQVREGAQARERGFRADEAEKQRAFGLEQTTIAKQPTVSQTSQRDLMQHQNRIAAGMQSMREQGATDEEIEAETKRYIRERAPQFGDVLTRRLFPKALAQ